MTGLMSERPVVAENKIAVQPGTERWTELVKTALAKDADRNWFLGDAALEIAPMGGNNNGKDSVEENLRRFASEIGIEYESVRKYRNVAEAWPSGNRFPDTSWKVHQMLAGHQAKIRPGMTVTQAHVAMGQSVAGRTGPNSSPRQRAEQVRDALVDPRVRAELQKIRDNPTDDALRILAGGGRDLTVEELNARHRDPLMDAVFSAVEGDPFADLEAAVTKFLKATPCITVESSNAERLRKLSYSLLDHIQIGVAR